MKAKVDPDLCTACELCVDEAPDVFEMEDDVAVEKVQVVPEGSEDAVRDAADSCPAEAIIIEE